MYLLEYIIDHNAKIPPVRYHKFNPQDKIARLLPTMGFKGTIDNKEQLYPISGLLLDFTDLPSTKTYRLIFCALDGDLMLFLYKYNNTQEYKKGVDLGDEFYDDGYFQNIMNINLSRREGQVRYLSTYFSCLRFAITDQNDRKTFLTWVPLLRSLFKDSWYLDDDISALRQCVKAFSLREVISYYAHEFSEGKFNYQQFTYSKNYGVPSSE